MEAFLQLNNYVLMKIINDKQAVNSDCSPFVPYNT